MAVLNALDKKLLRDFRRLWAQALAIALVLACGVSVLLMSLGMSVALDETRAAYYDNNRFADIFGDARRVPKSLIPEIQAIPGVWAVDTRISAFAILDIEGRVQSATGHILSLPENGEEPVLNLPLLRSGNWPAVGADDEIMVNAPFADALGFKPGDTFFANLNGSKRELRIVGTVLSPEFIYTIGPGSLMPNNENFGIIWMPEPAVAAAFDMHGAFSNVTLKLTKGTASEPVIEALDKLLEPYGGQGAHDRSLQQSDSFISAEIDQLNVMALILPPVFLGITIFLVHMVIGRIINLERSEIGLLKAIGYSDFEICVHYLVLAGLIALVGVVIGWVAGSWMAKVVALQYARFFDFPYLIYSVSIGNYIGAGVLGLAAATLGAIQSALGAARLPPAVAMSPPLPPRFRRNFLDRIYTALRLSQPTIMILRSVVRWPVRAALTSLGLALAVSVLIAAGFFSDSLEKIIDTAFQQANRQDAMLLFSQDVPESALLDVARLPGVIAVEGQQFHAAIFRNGHLTKRLAVEARRPGTDLSRIVDAEGQIVDATAEGMLISERVANGLNVVPGDVIEVEFLSGRRGIYEIPVTGTVRQFIGLGAYMDMDGLNRLFQRAPRISVANVLLDEGRTEELYAALKEIPKLSGTIMMTDNRRSFENSISENVTVMTTIYGILGILITVGVTYNGARVQLSERSRELASLRILGFTRGEVSYILVGETMLLALLAQPLGWGIGTGIASLMSSSFSSDLYSVPLILKPATYAFSSLIVLSAALGSALIVRQRLDKMNLVTVMKTRE